LLAHPSVLGPKAIRQEPAGAEIGALGEAVTADRIERCRAAARARPPAERHFSLQVFDLARLKARLGSRWAEQRARAVALIEAGLARELGPADLRLDDGRERIFIVRAARERREVERHGELLAAEVTARLCGTIPGGAIVRVTTLPIDPDAVLAGATTGTDLLPRLEAHARGSGRSVPDAPASSLADLRPRFQPILQLRKRLVSAYRLTAVTSDTRAPAEIEAALGETFDDWALREAIALLREPRHSREPALVVPVHYQTLAGMRARQLFSQHCRQLPARSSRQLVFEVQDLPPELPQARIRELLGYLRPFCLAILVRLHSAELEIGHLASSGVRGISLAAAHLAMGDTTCASSLTAIAGTARVAGMRSVLVDITRPSLCRAAQVAGIDHVSGDALMPPLMRPGRAFVVARGG
jgi:EAL domain-containing protein (putative c-di-GMP-specific phosphodiesterase class I)